MPTSRKRHSITETEDVGAALDRVRAQNGGRADLAELVKLGADEKLRRLAEQAAEDERRRQLRRRFGERTLTGAGIDPDALGDAHQHGWARG